MPDYTSIHYWIHHVATTAMVAQGDTEINCNHMVMAACVLDRAISQTPQGIPREPMQLQVNRVDKAFAAVGTKPANLLERLRGQLVVNSQNSSGVRGLVRFAPGVGELQPRAYTLAKPNPPEAAHYLVALLEKPTPELVSALNDLDVKPSSLIDALLAE